MLLTFALHERVRFHQFPQDTRRVGTGRQGKGEHERAVVKRPIEVLQPHAQRLWFLHAYQSYLFNKILAARIDRIDRLMAGDWAMKHSNGACFQVENAAVEQPRADTFEISPTGLLFGSRAPWASSEPGEIERAVAAEL
ncbi:MAG: hypothetical protein C4293_19975, partial [Nitrospiraceae bacterium]